MRKSVRSIVTATLLSATLGCGAAEEVGEDPDMATPDAERPGTPARPAERVIPVEMEGMEEQLREWRWEDLAGPSDAQGLTN